MNKILAKCKKELAEIEKQIVKGREMEQSTKKLSNKAKLYRKAISNLERNDNTISSLKPRTYYSIKIAHSSSNPIHRAIMYTEYDIEYGVVIFNNSYEPMAEKYSIKDIYYFEIFRELEEMNYYF